MFKLKSTSLMILFLLFSLTLYIQLKSQPATAQTLLATSLAKSTTNNIWVNSKVNHFYGNPTDVFIAEGDDLLVAHIGGIRWYDQATDTAIQALALTERDIVEQMVLVDNYLYIATTNNFWLVEWADSLIIRHHIPRKVTSFTVADTLIYLIFADGNQTASNLVTVLEHDPVAHTLTTRMEGAIEEAGGAIIGVKEEVVYVVLPLKIVALVWQDGAWVVTSELPAGPNRDFRQRHSLLHGSHILIDVSYQSGGGIGGGGKRYDELLIVDVSVATQLSFVSATTRYIHLLTSVGNTIYIDGEDNIELYELNQGQLNTIGSIPLDIVSQPVFITNDRLYTTNERLGNRQIDIYDLQDGNAPVVIGHYLPLVSCNTNITEFDNQYFLNWCRKDLRVMDPLGVGETAVLAAYTPTVPDSDSWYIANVLVQDQYAYLNIATYINNQQYYYINIIDLSNPQAPQSVSLTPIDQLRTRDTASFYKLHAISPDNILYGEEVAGENDGIDLIDVSNPLQPMRLSTLEETEEQASYLSIAINNNEAYLLKRIYTKDISNSFTTYYYLQTLDVSNTANPQIINSTSMSYTTQFILHDDILYANENYKLTMYDLSDPSSPNKIGQYDGCNDIRGITIEENRLTGFCFTATEVGNIIILDISEPTQPSFSSALWQSYETFNFVGTFPKIVALPNHIIVGEENSYTYSYGIDVWLAVRATDHIYLPFISKPE